MRLAAIAILAIAAPALAQTPAHDRISVTFKSWGSVVYSWTIERGGQGEQVTVADALSDKRKETRTTFSVSEAQFDGIRAKLAEAESHTAAGVDCKKEIFDLPYGEAVWTLAGARKKLSWDYGCRSADAEKVFGSLDAANDALARLDPATKDRATRDKQ